MKLVLLLGIVVLFATSARPNTIPACQTGTLASYEALSSGCLIGDLVFDSFSYHDTILANEPGVSGTWLRLRQFWDQT